jgi:phosphoribosylaminoimidazole-succinocarboxamide synthase
MDVNIILMSSGRGSTIKYLSEQPSLKSLIKLYIIENNENTKYVQELNNTIANNFYIFSREDNTGKFNYTSLFNVIKSYNTNIVLLAGWMHIIPETFINQLKSINCYLLNLHPTLPYQLIGKGHDIYPRIWEMYEEGMIKKTGAMIHHVSSTLDRGEPFYYKELDLSTCDTMDEYITTMYGNEVHEIVGLEKKCCKEALELLVEKIRYENRPDIVLIEKKKTSNTSFNSGLSCIHRGKVRDIMVHSEYHDWLFIKTSDRISANDLIITKIPMKGYYLNQINQFWHRILGLGQMINSSLCDYMVVKRLTPIPLEIIVRSRLYGSLWTAYQNGERNLYGISLPDGMNKGDVFPELIITPTTKGRKDKPITEKEILEQGILNKKEWTFIKNLSINMFKTAQEYLKYCGIEMIDTKFEFGFDTKGSGAYKSGNIMIIDEVFTPDSSRFIVDGNQLDKDILRKWVSENEEKIKSFPVNKDGTRKMPEGFFPNVIQEKLVSNYRDFYERITNKFIRTRYSPELLLEKFAIIIADSTNDYDQVYSLKNELLKQGIPSLNAYFSLNNNTKKYLEFLDKINEDISNGAKIVIITLEGNSNSNSFSGITVNYTSAFVINCPSSILKVNKISNEPVATIIGSDNVAIVCKKYLN